MAQSFGKGEKVKWNWGSGTGTGTIARRCTSRITLTIGGAEVTRNATEEELAYLIEQEDGGEVLKSGSELERA